MAASTQYHGVGKRKCAVARVYLRTGKGQININDKSSENYFDTPYQHKSVGRPFDVTNVGKNFDVHVNVYGGGKNAQAEAIGLGISRALLHHNEELRQVLRAHKLLTRDSRVVERKKYGQKKARKKFQFSKR